jgi:hypothetical protein
MTYAKAKQEYDERNGEGVGKRTDYRCRAHGCPNTGCIDDISEAKRGMCYFHFIEVDPAKWDAITQRIRGDFERMRNHGQPMRRSVEAKRQDLFAVTTENQSEAS